LSNPPCTLKGTGWNRWEWLCYDPQVKAIIPFEWNTSYRNVVKDNFVPCIELPMDQEPTLPKENVSTPPPAWSMPQGQSGCGITRPGDSFNAGFTSCASVANQ
jgi:hypothetical protein